MNYLCESISPKFPFRDSFQKNIEKNTSDFFQNTYGKGKNVLKGKYFEHMRKLVEIGESPVDEEKLRLIWLEIKSTGYSLSVEAFPDKILDSLLAKGDLRVKYGLIGPFLRCFRWAIDNGLEIPPKLNIKIYFWIADRPPWDVDGLPVFIPAGIPSKINLPLFPDVSYFHMQLEKKYTGDGADFSKLIDIFTREPNDVLNPILYFKGADTTRNNSDLRKAIVTGMKKYLDPETLDLEIVDGFKKFDPLNIDGLGKKYLLDLPGKFPWSVRLKMLFLFNGSPTIIKVNERWVANDGSWEDPEEPWVQWVDTFLPDTCYLSVTHVHTQVLKTYEKNMKIKGQVEKTNQKAREETLKKISDLVKEDSRPETPNLGHEILTRLSTERIYQMMFRLVLTIHALNKV